MKIRDLKLDTMSEKEIAIATHLALTKFEKTGSRVCDHLFRGLGRDKRKLLSFFQSIDYNNLETVVKQFDIQNQAIIINFGNRDYAQPLWRGNVYGAEISSPYYESFPSELVDEINKAEIDINDQKNASYANGSIVLSENVLGLYSTKDLREFIYGNVMPDYLTNQTEESLQLDENRFYRKWHIFRDEFGLAGQIDFVDDLSKEGFGLTNAPAFMLDYDGEESPEKIYWYEKYQVESWLKPLMENGFVFFTI